MTTSTDSTTTPLKRCPRCGEEKPATYEYFTWDKKQDKPLIWCRQCTRASNKRWREANLEKARAHILEWQRANRDKANECSRRYREAHPDRVKKSARAFRENHPELITEKRIRYQSENPEKGRAKRRRYRTRKAQLVYNFTPTDEKAVIEYFNHCCAVCGRQLKDLFGTHTLHFDHWIPLSKGGHTVSSNMIPLCGGKGGCNNSKGDKDPEQWLIERLGKRKAKTVLDRIRAYFEFISGGERDEIP